VAKFPSSVQYNTKMQIFKSKGILLF